LRFVWTCADRRDDCERGCPPRRPRFPAVCRRLALARGVRLLLRRRLYRRDLGARYAQSDDGLARDLPHRLVRVALLRQLRPVGRALGALRRARRAGGTGLSGIVEAVVWIAIVPANLPPSVSRRRRQQSPTASRGQCAAKSTTGRA